MEGLQSFLQTLLDYAYMQAHRQQEVQRAREQGVELQYDEVCAIF